ncbi:unnamed protein product [Pocillopora meandrina]|uniref:Reverse transcriptase domain-containing protein n=1 Tax=Pocillopora meandrina TaxID=46732 RepID=A0AAU9WF79_9CNID|nr:unnamed protein product [Pocillopora meandrina]
MTAKTVENKVNLVWKNICSRNKFPPFVVKSFVASNTDLPKFYHLIKTHKTGPDIKIRPIVSNINGPTQRISWLLSKTLKPLLTSVPTHLENSYELIERIQDGDSNNNKTLPYPCSLDTEGLPMGSSISGILAILFMDKLEQIALSSYRLISPYKRYVDDIYLQTANEEKANEFHDTMNSLHPRLKFEIEKPTASPEGLSLSLLDFKVTITTNGESSFEFYKKPAKKPLFVHHQSALPKRSKTNFIRNERRRIQQRCSTQITSNKHDRDFDNILRLNGYPERTIHETKHLQNHQRDPQTQTKEWHYLKIPFISIRPAKPKNHGNLQERKHPSANRPQVLHSETSPFTQLNRKEMQQTKLPHRRHQFMPTEKHRLSAHVQSLWRILHRKHDTIPT